VILDFGSINMDLVVPVATLPRPGETVLCEGYVTKPGGKGANQAVAAARAGATVAMAGAVGRDGFGAVLRENLAREGIDTGMVVETDRPTGVAYICVDAHAENFIAVAQGANLAPKAAQVPDGRLGPGTLVMMQMEIPPAENWALLERARRLGARSILNVAPAAAVPEAALANLDILVVNALEAETVAATLGLTAGTPSWTAQAIARRCGLTCVATLGPGGALAATADGAIIAVPALPVVPVDTTGAGDTFTGVLAAGIDAGLPLEAALRRASVGAALACLALGAQEAMPRAAAIDARLAELPG
jgi:ribokinase